GHTHFLVMEFVEGQGLDRVLTGKGRLPVSEACEYARQAALGLQHAFERGMVHRDIKPHNLMLTPQGQLKILDFGLARFVSEVILPAELPHCGRTPDTVPTAGETPADAVMGTADYLAPEEAQDARSAD